MWFEQTAMTKVFLCTLSLMVMGFNFKNGKSFKFFPWYKREDAWYLNKIVKYNPTWRTSYQAIKCSLTKHPECSREMQTKAELMLPRVDFETALYVHRVSVFDSIICSTYT